MEFLRLTTRDQAHSLAQCAYETYGLTFHRPWLYSGDEILEMNHSGDILSFVAMEGRRVVGHLALIRPCFDVFVEGKPLTDSATREVGLSMVCPSHQNLGIQNRLSSTALRFVMQDGTSGVYMKCVTHHTASQKSARHAGAVPTGLLLGSVPRWIRYDGEAQDKDQPISCVQYHLALQSRPSRIQIPTGFEWAWDVIRASGTERTTDPAARSHGETRMTTKWQGDRLLAQIYVSHAGPDLCEQLEQTLRWLVGGHMQHVMVYLPGDSAAVAEAGPRLEEIGIFPAAWIPDFFRGKRDALLFQASVFRGLDESRIRTEGPEAGAIATRVYNAWKRTRAADTTLPPKL